MTLFLSHLGRRECVESPSKASKVIDLPVTTLAEVWWFSISINLYRPPSPLTIKLYSIRSVEVANELSTDKNKHKLSSVRVCSIDFNSSMPVASCLSAVYGFNKNKKWKNKNFWMINNLWCRYSTTHIHETAREWQKTRQGNKRENRFLFLYFILEFACFEFIFITSHHVSLFFSFPYFSWVEEWVNGWEHLNTQLEETNWLLLLLCDDRQFFSSFVD